MGSPTRPPPFVDPRWSETHTRSGPDLPAPIPRSFAGVRLCACLQERRGAKWPRVNARRSIISRAPILLAPGARLYSYRPPAELRGTRAPISRPFLARGAARAGTPAREIVRGEGLVRRCIVREFTSGAPCIIKARVLYARVERESRPARRLRNVGTAPSRPRRFLRRLYCGACAALTASRRAVFVLNCRRRVMSRGAARRN